MAQFQHDFVVPFPSAILVFWWKSLRLNAEAQAFACEFENQAPPPIVYEEASGNDASGWCPLASCCLWGLELFS